MRHSGRSTSSRSKQGGFITMIEAVIATSLAAVLATAAIPGLVNKVLTRAADKAVEQMYVTGTTAQSYRQKNGGWPDAANNCVGAISVLVTGGYLAGFSGVTPYGTTLTTNCTGGNVFTVTAVSETPKWAQYMAGQLFAATVTGSNVASAFPLPGGEPALANLLHRFADPTNPQYNEMETDLAMHNNSIRGTNIYFGTDLQTTTAEVSNQIVWGPSHSTLSGDSNGAIEIGADNATVGGGSPYIDFHYANGVVQDYNVRLQNDADGQLTANAALFNVNGDAQVQGNLGLPNGGIAVSGDVVNTQLNRSLGQAVTDVAIVSNDPTNPTRIAKPNCGLLGLSPRIDLAIAGIAVGNPSYPIYQAYTRATDNGDGTWTPHMFVLTSNNTSVVEADPTYAQMLTIVKCD